tara:strand:+ start:100 stop:519 length:420 start_codon:yes stop_codon:yes gene_type:complete
MSRTQTNEKKETVARKTATVAADDSQVVFYVNDQKVVLDNPDPLMTLNDYLRTTVGLNGTKRMCNQGGCGCCTVLLTGTDENNGKQATVSVNSCLRMLASVDGMHVTTIEGMGNKKDGLDPVQKVRINTMFLFVFLYSV